MQSHKYLVLRSGMANRRGKEPANREIISNVLMTLLPAVAARESDLQLYGPHCQHSSR